ncbi:fc1a7353-7411-44c1-a837-39d338ff29bb [Thermothielavioides terrestris]|uniref:Fc1a7353-7411-44c1-a837-39d338ff29bb n=1 Tax=Thermothielavioides terrestris TaxID=2587410 RepID=A0A3S5CVL5_9PEZI|nr:fc1a7353-7411-44c1-a837-39d338ff29bb [Thermothielavioides terrestris]
MCLVFTCGEHTFRREVEGYEGLVCQCHNCGNYSASVIRSHPWFTFCFVGLLEEAAFHYWSRSTD